jgi:hypothetical protein
MMKNRFRKLKAGVIRSRTRLRARFLERPDSRWRLRTVVFSSWRARSFWAVAGLLALIGGFLLFAPSLERASDSPQPWGLWIGTDGAFAPSPAVGRLLLLEIEAEEGCEGPVTVKGLMQWEPSHRWVARHSPNDLIPNRLVLGIAGVKVLGAEVRDLEKSRWRRVVVTPYAGISILDSRIDGSSLGLADVRFRLSLDAISPAGFEACSTSSPAILEHQGGDPEFDRATNAITYPYQHHLRGTGEVEAFNVNDALVWMSVEGHQPDRGLLDHSSRVVANRVLVTCTSSSPGALSLGPPRDLFSAFRQALEESSCGSVQTFRRAGAAETLNARVFLAGILISVGVTLLFEALLMGKTAPQAGRPERRNVNMGGS